MAKPCLRRAGLCLHEEYCLFPYLGVITPYQRLFSASKCPHFDFACFVRRDSPQIGKKIEQIPHCHRWPAFKFYFEKTEKKGMKRVVHTILTSVLCCSIGMSSYAAPPKAKNDNRLYYVEKVNFTQSKLTVGQLIEQSRQFIPAKQLMKAAPKFLPVWDRALPRRSIHKGKIFVNGHGYSVIIEPSKTADPFWVKVNGQKLVEKDFQDLGQLFDKVQTILQRKSYSLHDLWRSRAEANLVTALIIGAAIVIAAYLLSNINFKVDGTIDGETNHNLNVSPVDVDTNHTFEVQGVQ